MPSNPTDKSVGYDHSSAWPTFAAKPIEAEMFSVAQLLSVTLGLG